MNKEYFTDNLSVEDIAEMTDKMLRFEHNQKSKKQKPRLLKITSTVAAVLLVVGLANNTNIFSVINSGGIDGNRNDVNPGASVISENPETSIDIADIYDETVTTQIGRLIITTLRGQEPIQNDDRTITLPGGGTYIGTRGDKFTLSGAAVINSYGGVLMSLSPNLREIIIERPNGDITIFDETWIAMTEEDYLAERARQVAEWRELQALFYTNPEKFWDKMPDIVAWRESHHGNMRRFNLRDGTQIETGNLATKQDWYAFDLNVVVGNMYRDPSIILEWTPTPIEVFEKILEHLKSVTLPSFNSRNDIEPDMNFNRNMSLMITMDESTITLANDMVIEVPPGTLIVVRFANVNPEMEITVGIGNATITRPDGTYSAVPAGTIIDGEGNIIE